MSKLESKAANQMKVAALTANMILDEEAAEKKPDVSEYSIVAGFATSLLLSLLVLQLIILTIIIAIYCNYFY